MRELAEREGIATVGVPPSVGGRFSVLSPVGLLPAALVGIDIDGPDPGGPGRARARCRRGPAAQLRPALYAALQWAADTWLGAGIHVLMPYTDRLREFAEWYRQLWAESLGKRVDRRGGVVHVGPTPVAAVGATDQHSQVQLFMEGPVRQGIPSSSWRTWARRADPRRAELARRSFLSAGASLGQLLRAEYEATSTALARMGRMNQTLHLPDLAAASVGELLMFFQIATGYAGAWYGIDPFDQPGVELGKRLTYAAMGRAGHAEPEPAPAHAGDEA